MIRQVHPEIAGQKAAEHMLDREVKIAMDLARQAGQLLREKYSPNLEVHYKSNHEIVTAADLESSELICRGLSAAFPDDAIRSEETAKTEIASTAGRVWIIDPLDSTSNYIQGGNEYSLSIGLAIAGEAVLGVVFNPSRNELFSGYVGYGASWNGVPVRASVISPPHRPRVLVSSKEWKRGLSNSPGCHIIPMASMAYKLARVSAGLEDGVLSLKERKPWGTCAGAALVLSAGGRVTSLDGRTLAFDCNGPRTFHGLVASGARLHTNILELAAGLEACVPARSSA
jgi:myo-inositol-1(or 4)-monophosphatase